MTRHQSYSIEFFPPRGAKAAQRLHEARGRLARLSPEFFSVTFGAGGTTRSGTWETVRDTMQATHIPAAPHLSCIEGTHESIGALLDNYAASPVDRIVTLRGDLPPGMEKPGVFHHASDLVAFIRQRHGDRFRLEVAAYPEYHPETPSADADLAHFVNKVRAGADSAMTQYFYNADAYFRFVDAVTARGVDIPIVPGIMPLTSFAQIARFSDACGAEIPRWIRRPMETFGDDAASIRAFGRDVVARLCEQLLAGGAPGLHFYSLNQATETEWLWRVLNLPTEPLPATV